MRMERGGATNQGCGASRSWKSQESKLPRSLQRDQTGPGLGFTPKGLSVRAATVISHRREAEPGRLGGEGLWAEKPTREKAVRQDDREEDHSRGHQQ